MSILRATIITALLVLPNALPAAAFARPNNGGFQRSSEGNTVAVAADACDTFKTLLDRAEKKAARRAGTKAAAPHAREADLWWDAAAAQGCSWTK